jgi:rhamnosyltransferase
MTAFSICAVMVSFEPTEPMIANLQSILAQTQALVVVDNGSSQESLGGLRLASQAFGFALIENEINVGIAEALNQGIRSAVAKGFSWVILLDQDSVLTDGFIDRLFSTWQSHPQRERIGSMHPTYRNPDTGIVPKVLRAPDGGPVASITSGALMPVWIFEKVDWFASEFFIDWVDIEYSLRIRTAGYLVADSADAVLLHTAGRPKQVKFLGFTFQPSHHSATRRYYISRNRVVVFRRYFRVFPRWIALLMYEAFRETVKCFLAEENRSYKFRNFVLGSWDGLTGRMGKREGL